MSTDDLVAAFPAFPKREVRELVELVGEARARHLLEQWDAHGHTAIPEGVLQTLRRLDAWGRGE